MSNNNTRGGKILIALGILIIILPALIWYWEEKSNSTDSDAMLIPHIETTTSTPHAVVALKTARELDDSQLNEKIEKILSDRVPEGKDWTFGIAITDITTGKVYGKNEHEVFDAASTGKIIILATLYNQISEKKLNEDDKVTITDSDVQDYGTGIIRYKKMPVTYTLRELAELMIKQSDNTAASVIATKVGRKNISDYATKVGMTETDIEENTTTPYDINLILRNIYNIKQTDPQTAGTLIKIMLDSDFETRLPAQLPKDTLVAHKIGTGIAQIHDAGIVLLDKRPYILSIFSKHVNDETLAEEIIALLSKTVYDEFSSLSD